jgi:hypothetical protein
MKKTLVLLISGLALASATAFAIDPAVTYPIGYTPPMDGVSNG